MMDVNERLFLAISNSDINYDDVRILLAEGADPCVQFGSSRQSALLLSVDKGEERLLQLFLTHSQRRSMAATRNAQGLDVLMAAANQGQTGCVNLLLSAGFKSPQLLNRRVDRGQSSERSTALMLACTEGHIQVARVLLDSGADPNLSDGRGRSPVHVSSVQGNMELLQELKQHGAELTGVVDHQGNTPMHFCTHPHILEFLYHEGVSPFASNHQGSTPLDVLKRLNLQSPAVSLLQQLQEDEQRRAEAGRLGVGGRLLWGLWWLAGDVTRDVGWKVVVVVVALICLLAWQLTVYLHGQSPLGPYTYTA